LNDGISSFVLDIPHFIIYLQIPLPAALNMVSMTLYELLVFTEDIKLDIWQFPWRGIIRSIPSKY